MGFLVHEKTSYITHSQNSLVLVDDYNGQHPWGMNNCLSQVSMTFYKRPMNFGPPILLQFNGNCNGTLAHIYY